MFNQRNEELKEFDSFSFFASQSDVEDHELFRLKK